MNNTMRILWLPLVLLIGLACSSKVTSTGSSAEGSGKYSEDLSVWRATELAKTDTIKNQVPVNGTETTRDPAKFVEARHAVNQTLDTVLDSISRYNLENGVVDGFTIQVYSGIKREEALNVRKQLAITLPDLEADVQYVQPNFRVRMGKYFTRLEAQEDYMTVKKHFPNAIVIPDRIRF